MPTPKRKPTDLITQSDAAELKGVGLNVINNWVRRGYLRHYRQFDKTLVSKAEVLAYQSRRPGKPSKAA